MRRMANATGPRLSVSLLHRRERITCFLPRRTHMACQLCRGPLRAANPHYEGARYETSLSQQHIRLCLLSPFTDTLLCSYVMDVCTHDKSRFLACVASLIVRQLTTKSDRPKLVGIAVSSAQASPDTLTDRSPSPIIVDFIMKFDAIRSICGKAPLRNLNIFMPY